MNCGWHITMCDTEPGTRKNRMIIPSTTQTDDTLPGRIINPKH